MSTLRTVDRTFLILRMIADHPNGVGVNAIARATDLPSSTASRILSALEGWEAVFRTDDNRFHIGPELVRLVQQQPFTQNLTALARPILQTIADTTEEAIALCVLDDHQTYYLDHIQSSQAVRVRDWTGERLPLHVAAPGKIFLAYASPEFVDTVLTQPLTQYARQTILSTEKLRAQLQQIRVSGYSVSDEEYAEGVLGFGVPVKDADHQVVAAFNLYGPKFRLEDPKKQEKIIQILLESAAELEERLM
ncbi:MAG: IclR family transcriptional regulator [Chloroflexota bacterium]